MNKDIIIYDFDGTITPYPLPKYEILERCGFDGGMMSPYFMKLVKKKEIPLYSAVMSVFFEVLKSNGYRLIDDNFCLGCKSVEYNTGVGEFLSILKSDGVKNYLVSSGLKVYLERIDIADYFKDIYATTFLYDENSDVSDILCIVDDKYKVDCIKDILKKNECSDASRVIYIGDGLTDFEAMSYVINNGGVTILVYKNYNKDIDVMKEKGVVSFCFESDFSFDSDLSRCIRKLCNK